MTLAAEEDSENSCSRIGEVVGGTAAVCCCFPFAVMHLLILAVYKVPSGLWRKKKNLQKRRLLMKKNKDSSSPSTMDLQPKKIMLDTTGDESDDVKDSDVGLEMEMWDHFYRGFWRSPSQKED